MKSFIAIVAAAALVLMLTACGQPAPERKSIAATAAELGDFDTLLTALTEAELAGTFAAADTGPFTVFAPTDEAFVALLEVLDVTADELLADVDLVTQVLLYRVVPGTLFAVDVLAAVEAGDGSVDVETLQGDAITVTAPDGVVLNGDVNVIAADVTARNGVIHVIDAVLLPSLD